MRLHFVVGTGRCGSSLVHEIMANHEGVSFVSNLDDNLPRLDSKGRFNNALYGLTKGSLTRKGRTRFAPSEAYRLVSARVSPVYANSVRDLVAGDVTPWLQRRFTEFFETRYRAQGRMCFLHKYTGWPRIGFFARIFPEAKFVHIVRDGRAVANSWLQMQWWGGYRGPNHWPWGALGPEHQNEWEASDFSFVSLAGLSWRILMESFQHAKSAFPGDRYLEVRYEDFLNAPEDVLREIAEFVGLSWSRRLASAAARARVNPSRERAFERDLTPAQVAELERSIGPLLRQFGYE